ncbi:MAG TPA: hypothetical protein VFB21_23175 [Chthonomonadaceae bacterium]|nr:hypothetical protein [Chthonomonadaceae bacterium]
MPRRTRSLLVSVVLAVGLLFGLCLWQRRYRTQAHRKLLPAPLLAAAPAPLLPSPVPLAGDFAVPVRMYHRISDLTPREARSPLMRDLTVAPKDFERQVKYLVDSGFTLLLAREIEQAVCEGRPLPARQEGCAWKR